MDKFKPQPYKPTMQDTEWALQFVRVMKDGGMWGFPATGLVYKIDKINKTLTLQNPELLINTQTRVLHERGRITFAEIGYRFLDKAA